MIEVLGIEQIPIDSFKHTIDLLLLIYYYLLLKYNIHTVGTFIVQIYRTSTDKITTFRGKQVINSLFKIVRKFVQQTCQHIHSIRFS